MKPFNKVQFLSDSGLLACKFDYATVRFERSAVQRLKATLILFLIASFSFKYYLATFFKREDPIQLQIGSVFNYLPDLPRQFMAYVGLVEVSWMFAIHWTFNYAKGKRRLLFQWMKLSYEISASSARDYKVAGLSAEKNKAFWLAEKRWNGIWYRTTSSIILSSCFLFSIQFFFVSFDVDLFTYAFFQVINIGHLFFFLLRFLQIIYTLNVFVLTLIRFFGKKFDYINWRIEHLYGWKKTNKKVINRKLAELLAEYNVVHLELFAMRDLFKQLIGFNVCHCFALCVLTTFACLFADMRMAVAVLVIIFVIGLATIFPFYFANFVITQSDRAMHSLENVSFRRSTRLAIKLKIDSLGNLNQKIGFTCFDWFRIGPLNGVLILFEFLVYLFLLLQGYYLYRAF